LKDDYFSLFGLPACYALDAVALERAWREVAARVHPDRYATAGPAEKRVAMQWAARVNEAYRVLRDPLARARYLCEQAGVDLQTENNTAMAAAFLMQQMQWRESLDEAGGDAQALAALAAELGDARQALQEAVRGLLDEARNPTEAALRVREWMFLQKLADDVDVAMANGEA